jgi:DNA mismatch repair protein MutL
MPISAAREGIRLSGFAGLPTFNRANSLQQFMFVNGRAVRDPLLTGALRAAYADVLARDRFPVVTLFVEVAAMDVDVNVHPAKTEVRFRDPGLVRGLIVGALKDALSAHGFRSSRTVGAATLAAFRPGRHARRMADRGTDGRRLPVSPKQARQALRSRHKRASMSSTGPRPIFAPPPPSRMRR